MPCTVNAIRHKKLTKQMQQLLVLGEKPTVSSGTLFRVAVGELIQGSKWSCMLMQSDDKAKKINVQVHVPPNAIVGRYKLTVEISTRLADGPKTVRIVKPDVIVLFNPFAPGK